LVVEIQPSVFVLENVKGLTLGKHKAFLDEVVAEFAFRGYEVALPWRVLNARDYGVPQDRQRLFLIGSKKGVPLPEYPEALGYKAIVTCEDALDDLPNAEEFEDLIDHDTVAVGARKSHLSRYAREMRCLDRESWRFGYVRKWDKTKITSSMRTNHTEISRRRFEQTLEGTVEPISRFFKLPRNGVSNTLRAGTDSSRGAFTSPRPIHYKYNRCITVREMARLHGFPDWFRFHPTKWHGARQIGNAVPPPLARAVAERIIGDSLGIAPTRPKRALNLDCEDLLSMDMKSASAYWDVDIPIGRRDRKSGATKRKQIAIELERERLTG
jgi:DNA (cytosine-5)-methyltransferase 1